MIIHASILICQIIQCIYGKMETVLANQLLTGIESERRNFGGTGSEIGRIVLAVDKAIHEEGTEKWKER